MIGGEYRELSRHRVCKCVHLNVCCVRHAATQLLKQSCNYLRSCLVGPVSIPVEQQTIWAPAQICRESSC